MKNKFIVVETVKHFHEVEIDEELSIENILEESMAIIKKAGTGYEAIEMVLEDYEDMYGFEYFVQPNYAGTETENIEVEELIE